MMVLSQCEPQGADQELAVESVTKMPVCGEASIQPAGQRCLQGVHIVGRDAAVQTGSLCEHLYQGLLCVCASATAVQQQPAHVVHICLKHNRRHQHGVRNAPA